MSPNRHQVTLKIDTVHREALKEDIFKVLFHVTQQCFEKMTEGDRETHPLWPAHWSYWVAFYRKVTQTCHLKRRRGKITNISMDIQETLNTSAYCRPSDHTHLARAGTPQVDAGTQSNTEHVQRGPVH